jgi:hypothetical protein
MTDLEQAIDDEDVELHEILAWATNWSMVQSAVSELSRMVRSYARSVAREKLRALPPVTEPAQGLTREKLDALIRKLGIAPDEPGWYGVEQLRDAILATTGEPEPVECPNVELYGYHRAGTHHVSGTRDANNMVYADDEYCSRCGTPLAQATSEGEGHD